MDGEDYRQQSGWCAIRIPHLTFDGVINLSSIQALRLFPILSNSQIGHTNYSLTPCEWVGSGERERVIKSLDYLLSVYG